MDLLYHRDQLLAQDKGFTNYQEGNTPIHTTPGKGASKCQLRTVIQGLLHWLLAKKAKGRPASWTWPVRTASMQGLGPGRDYLLDRKDAGSRENKKGIKQILEKKMSTSCLRRES